MRSSPARLTKLGLSRARFEPRRIELLDSPTVANEYDDLRAKVDVVCEEIARRRRGDLECRLGCTQCCNVQLQVTPIEADSIRMALAILDDEARERIRLRGLALLEGEGPPADDATCAMLEPDGSCAIYAHRPIACRLAGHALLYPPKRVPRNKVRATAKNGEITWCELNYVDGKPKSEDVIQAGYVESALANANVRAKQAAYKRRSMVSIAIEPSGAASPRGAEPSDDRTPG